MSACFVFDAFGLFSRFGTLRTLSRYVGTFRYATLYSWTHDLYGRSFRCTSSLLCMTVISNFGLIWTHLDCLDYLDWD